MSDALLSFFLQIIRFAVGSYVVVLLLRFLMQKLGASWHNQFSQFVIKITEKPLTPFRRIIPGVKGFDLSILVFAFILQFIGTGLIWLIALGHIPHAAGVLLLSISSILSKFIHIYIYAIFISVIASWILPLQMSPIMHIVSLLVDPLLSFIRRYIPLIAGIDLSPIPALLGLTFLNLLINTPLDNMGMHILMFGL